MAHLSKRVLLVDNNPHVLHSLSLNIRLAGYEVVPAWNVASALEALQKEIVHAAIVDLRLENEKAPEDISGFQVAEAIPDYIPFLMYTGYKNEDNTHDSLAKRHAKEILDKRRPDAPTLVLNEIDRFFKDHIKVNFDLRVDETIKSERIAAHIKVPHCTTAIPSADDVRQILATLFFKADRIRVVPFLPARQTLSGGGTGAVVIQVQPQMEGTWAPPAIVKFGARDEILAEASNYERLHQYLGGEFHEVLDATALSRGIGGLRFTLIGAQDWKKIRPLADILRRQNPRRAVKLADDFFTKTFQSLYEWAERKKVDLAEEYTSQLHLTPTKLRGAMALLHPQEGNEKYIHLDGVKEELINPVEWVVSGDEFRPMPVATRVCLCHGDLNSRNVLVDPEGHCWLIDFGRVSRDKSHVLGDFAELENDIKFNLLAETNLKTLLRFEKALLAPEHCEQNLPAVKWPSEPIRRAYTLLRGLRASASRLVHTDGDMREYYIALLFHALKTLRLDTIKPKKKQHALMSAALICDRLDNWGGPALRNRP